MDRYAKLVILAALCSVSAAYAQTYQVGQYLGNMNELNRLTYSTMGSAAQHANYTAGGANWTTLAGQNAARMSGTATATIGGRTVALTAISRVPLPAIASAARALSMATPATAAVTLLGFAAMQGWLTPAGLEWNHDSATNITHPFVGWEEGCVSGTCSQYASGLYPVGQEAWTTSRESACAGGIAWVDANDANNMYRVVGIDAQGRCVGESKSNAASTWAQFTTSIRTRTVIGLQPVPKTWDQAEPLLGQPASDYGAVDWKGITEGLLRAGGSISPSSITTTVSGPSSQAGQRTERTLSNGDKSVTQTTHNYTYNNNNVTHNTTTTTTVTNINNEVVDETTETTDNPVPDEPPPDLCEKNPEILACQKVVLKDLQAKDVPNENRPLAITPDSGWSQGAGACPQPKTITFMGTQLAFEYTLFCDFASAIKPLFIGFAWLSATLTFFGVARRD